VTYRAQAEQARPRRHWNLRLVAQGREAIVDLHALEDDPLPERPLEGHYQGTIELENDRHPIRLLIIPINDRRAYFVLRDDHGNALSRIAGAATITKGIINRSGEIYSGDFESVTLQESQPGQLAMRLTPSLILARIENGLVRASLSLTASNGGTEVVRTGLLRARWIRALTVEESAPPTVNAAALSAPSVDDINAFAVAVKEHIDISFSDDWALSPDQHFNGQNVGSIALCGSERGRSFGGDRDTCQQAEQATGCNCERTCIGMNCNWYCGFPSPSRDQCLQYLMCYQGHQNDELNSSEFLETPGSDSGDPKCDARGGARLQQTFPGLTVRDVRAGGPNLAVLLNGCLDELSIIDLPEFDRPGRSALTVLMPERICFGPARFHTVLEDAMRNLVAAGRRNAETGDEAGAKMTQHLLASWVRLHTMLADETQRAHGISRLLSTPVLSFPPFDDVAQALTRSWELFLMPRVQTALKGIPSRFLIEPDYRNSFGVRDHNERDPQKLPLAQQVIEGLSRQIAFFEQSVYRQRFLPENTIETSKATSFLSKSSFIEALAIELAEQTGRGNWRAGFDAALDEARTARQRLSAQINWLRSGSNPLGIADTDLVLLRDRNETGGIARYFSNVKRFADRLATKRNEVHDLERQIDAAWQNELQTEYRSFEFDQVSRDISARYLDGLTNLCGDGDYTELIAAESQTDIEQAISACFVDNDRRECELNTDEFLAELSADDLAYQVCVMAKLKRNYGDDLETRNQQLNELVNAWNDQVPENVVDWVRARVDRLRSAILNERGASARAELPDQQRARAACGALLPSARQTLNMPHTGVNALANCYRGALGEQAISVLLAAEQIETARAQVAALSEDYNLSMSSCLEQRATEDQRAAMQSEHDDTMGLLSALKLGSDLAAMVVKNNVDVQNVLTFGGKGAAATLADGSSLLLGARMAQVERSHQSSMQRLQAESSLRLCYINAQRSLTGLRTATHRIEEAYLRLEQTQTRLRNMGSQAVRTVKRARAELRRAVRRPTAHLAQRAKAEIVEQYEQGMMSARKLAYLAVRSLESARQSTLASLRRAALGARNTEDLRTLVNGLNEAVLSESVQSRAIGDSRIVAVISLKDHLLIMQDASDLNPKYQNLSTDEAFGAFLTRAQHAIYNDDGALAGYHIPFSLIPYQAVNLFRPDSMASDPLFNAQTCAERLWSFAISFTGPRSMLEGSNSLPMVNVRKSNTFISQNCSTEGDAFVSESLRTWGSLNPESDGNKNAYTEIPYQVLQNQSVDALNGDAVAGNRTFAGTGLFGDYGLYFPAAALATDANSSGLHLERIQDILLRFEYNSAAAPQR
jgi:hypothetical protein